MSNSLVLGNNKILFLHLFRMLPHRTHIRRRYTCTTLVFISNVSLSHCKRANNCGKQKYVCFDIFLFRSFFFFVVKVWNVSLVVVACPPKYYVFLVIVVVAVRCLTTKSARVRKWPNEWVFSVQIYPYIHTYVRTYGWHLSAYIYFY